MKHICAIFLIFHTALFAVSLADENASDEIVIFEKIQEKYKYGDPVKFKVHIKKDALVDGSANFKCYVYSMSDGKLSEEIPSIEAKSAKPKDPIYSYPKNQNLTWDYMSSPDYMRPVTGVKYSIVVGILIDGKKKLIAGPLFEFIQ